MLQDCPIAEFIDLNDPLPWINNIDIRPIDFWPLENDPKGPDLAIAICMMYGWIPVARFSPDIYYGIYFVYMHIHPMLHKGL